MIICHQKVAKYFQTVNKNMLKTLSFLLHAQPFTGALEVLGDLEQETAVGATCVNIPLLIPNGFQLCQLTNSNYLTLGTALTTL